jgi:hypothetical protein
MKVAGGQHRVGAACLYAVGQMVEVANTAGGNHGQRHGVADCSGQRQIPRLLAPTLFRVASAAQQLYALATSHKEREASNFKELVAQIVTEVCKSLDVPVRHNACFPISGDLEADHVIGQEANPIIVISATSAKRLLESEVIHMQYRLTKTPDFVLAVAESQKVVGVKQFNRANYYTGKTVQFSPVDFAQLLRGQLLH